jgi:hypothetical protein
MWRPHMFPCCSYLYHSRRNQSSCMPLGPCRSIRRLIVSTWHSVLRIVGEPHSFMRLVLWGITCSPSLQFLKPYDVLSIAIYTSNLEVIPSRSLQSACSLSFAPSSYRTSSGGFTKSLPIISLFFRLHLSHHSLSPVILRQTTPTHGPQLSPRVIEKSIGRVNGK